MNKNPLNSAFNTSIAISLKSVWSVDFTINARAFVVLSPHVPLETFCKQSIDYLYLWKYCCYELEMTLTKASKMMFSFKMYIYLKCIPKVFPKLLKKTNQYA